MKELLELAENGDVDGFRKEFNSVISSIVVSKINEKSKIISEQGSDVPDPTTVAGTLEDPMIDPNFDKEVFYKRYPVGKREVVIKRVGSGPNAPAISYVDGIRYEVFVTPQQAEKETKRAIEDGSFDRIQKEKEKKAKEAAAAAAKDTAPSDSEEKPKPPLVKENKKTKEELNEESLGFFASIVKDRQEKRFIFDTGEGKIITIDEAADTLEMLKQLNNMNQSRFIEQMRSGLTQYQDMMDFLLDRIRKGVI